MIVIGPFLWCAWPAIDRVLIAYAGTVFLFAGLAAAAVDPASAKQRAGEDRASEAILFLGSAAGIILGGLDVGRWHLTDRVPEALRIAALAIVIAGYALRFATIRVNTFFSNLLLIQRDRHHTVIDRGPYAIIRHPGYASLLLILPATALAIGSLLALAPLLIAALRILTRTAKEDAFLQKELAGYTAYAGRVRHRLIPGVW